MTDDEQRVLILLINEANPKGIREFARRLDLPRHTLSRIIEKIKDKTLSDDDSFDLLDRLTRLLHERK